MFLFCMSTESDEKLRVVDFFFLYKQHIVSKTRHGNVTLTLAVQDKALGEVLHSACFTFVYLCLCVCH